MYWGGFAEVAFWIDGGIMAGAGIIGSFGVEMICGPAITGPWVIGGYCDIAPLGVTT
jgi:hypothetical protein